MVYLSVYDHRSVALLYIWIFEGSRERATERSRPWERQNNGKLIFLFSVFSIMLSTQDISHTKSILGYLPFPRVIADAVFNLGWHQSFPLTKSPVTTLAILDKGLKNQPVTLYNHMYLRLNKLFCDFRVKMFFYASLKPCLVDNLFTTQKRAFMCQCIQFFYINPLYQSTDTKRDVYSWIFISTSF